MGVSGVLVFVCSVDGKTAIDCNEKSKGFLKEGRGKEGRRAVTVVDVFPALCRWDQVEYKRIEVLQRQRYQADKK